MDKHTPAPWIIDDSRCRTAINTKGYPGDGEKHITLVNWGSIDGLTQEEHDANCALIAYAPDMLEALKRAEQTIRNISLNLPDGDLKTIAHNESVNLGNDICNAQAGSRTPA